MTTEEKMAIRQLKNVSFGVYNSKKRFVCDLAAKPEDSTLTPRQRLFLWSLVKSFRAQLNPELVVLGAAQLEDAIADATGVPLPTPHRALRQHPAQRPAAAAGDDRQAALFDEVLHG